MARRRSRRRKSSYREEPESSGFPPQLVVEDLSPRARRLVEGGLIDLDAITGSGEDGRITSGDILHAARVLEMEKSVARIENVARAESPVEPPPVPEQPNVEAPMEEPPSDVASPEAPAMDLPQITDEATTTTAAIADAPLEVAHNPWDAYNGVSEGLSESALPGAEQSWGEAEANIAAIAEEAAAQIYGRPAAPEQPAELPVEPAPIEPAEPVAQPGPDLIEQAPAPADQAIPPMPEAPEQPETQESTLDVQQIVAAAEPPLIAPEPTAVVASLSDIEAAVDPEPEEQPAEAAADHVPEPDQVAEPEPVEVSAEQVAEPEPIEAGTEQTPEHDRQEEVMMDFGTLEMVDPESVWAEGAEDFAPWFLAHSRQLGDVLGLEAGLSDARQFTTKSATGVVGRDDNDEDVVVVSTQDAVADDSDLGRALGMAASSGAATVALVSAKFNEDQLKALAWLNSQTKSGVQWYAIEMRVVRIADSPAAMLFDLVASPPKA